MKAAKIKSEKFQDDYFSSRGIKDSHYVNSTLPRYMFGVLPENKNASILDIGCGFGQMLKSLKDNGYLNLHGVDINAKAVALCRSNGLEVEKIGNLSSFSRSHRKKYDFIIMSHVIEHLPKSEIISHLSIIRGKLLKPDGKFLAIVPNAQSNTGAYWAYEDFTHSTIFTTGSLIYVLKESGFDEVKLIDLDNLQQTRLVFRFVRRFLLSLYRFNYYFWNRVTLSSFHVPSPPSFGYEIKALASGSSNSEN